MGQKVHPTGFRLGIVKDHSSVWYADGATYAEKLHIDLKVREYIRKISTGVCQSDRNSASSTNCEDYHSYSKTWHRHRQKGRGC